MATLRRSKKPDLQKHLKIELDSTIDKYIANHPDVKQRDVRRALADVILSRVSTTVIRMEWIFAAISLVFLTGAFSVKFLVSDLSPWRVSLALDLISIYSITVLGVCILRISARKQARQVGK